MDFPEINWGFFNCIIRLVSISKQGRPFTTNLQLSEDLKLFYDNHYQYLIEIKEEKQNIRGLKNCIDYMITDMITDLENNIKMRYLGGSKSNKR